MRDERESQLLIYDDECRLCVATKQRLERAVVGTARCHIRFVPYQSAEARQALGLQYRPGRPDMAFLVEPSGVVRRGIEAFVPFLPELPMGEAGLWLLRLPFGRAIAVWIYRLVARYRYHLFGTARHAHGIVKP